MKITVLGGKRKLQKNETSHSSQVSYTRTIVLYLYTSAYLIIKETQTKPFTSLGLNKLHTSDQGELDRWHGIAWTSADHAIAEEKDHLGSISASAD